MGKPVLEARAFRFRSYSTIWLLVSRLIEVLRSYPSLDQEAVQDALLYAAELAREQVVAIPA